LINKGFGVVYPPRSIPDYGRFWLALLCAPLEPLKKWVLEANQADKAVSENNWLEMKSFLQKVGSNRLLRSQTLTVSFTKPAYLLAETNIAVRSTNDVSAQNSGWWSRGESNP
jgi:hypothetical protein